MWKIKPKDLNNLYDEYGCYCRVDFCISKLVEQAYDETEYYDTINGKVYAVQDSGEENVVGRIVLFRFKLDLAAANDFDFYELFDAVDADTGSLGEILFDQNTRDFKTTIQKAFFPNIAISKVLHVNRLDLEDDYRGLGLGRCVIERAIDTLEDHEMITTVKPFPLQWERKEDEINPKDMEKVVQFWKSVGFKQIQQSKFFTNSKFV